MTNNRKSLAQCLALSPEYRPDFSGWIVANWHVYEAFEFAALAWLKLHDRCSSKMLFEHLRYQTGIREAESVWKLNNNYTADCARLFERFHPEYAGCFEKRARAA